MPFQVYTYQTHRASEYGWLDGYVLPPSVMHMLLIHHVPTDVYLLHCQHHLYLSFAVSDSDSHQCGAIFRFTTTMHEDQTVV